MSAPETYIVRGFARHHKRGRIHATAIAIGRNDIESAKIRVRIALNAQTVARVFIGHGFPLHESHIGLNELSSGFAR